MSNPGNKLIPYDYIGRPYHGLATDRILSTSDGDKTIHSGGTSGACQVVRHPLAPGPIRNPNQIARDTALGLDWRDYALLTGEDHGVNGSQTQIGALNWLYCDAGGNTWVISAATYDSGIEPPPVTHEGVTVDHVGTIVTHTGTLQNSEMEFYIWLEAIFGRTGKPYPFERRFLTSLRWSPTIPSWYSGFYSASDVVTRVALFSYGLVLSPDGSSVLIHLYCDDRVGLDGALNREVYPETQPYDYANAQLNGASMIGILKCDLSGVGDINNNGIGVECLLSKHYDYEQDIVLFRDETDPFVPDPLPGCGMSWTGIPAKPVQGCGDGEVTLDWDDIWTQNPSGNLSGTSAKSGTDNEAIMYLTFSGQITRKYQKYSQQDFSYIFGGSHSYNFRLSNCDKGNGLWPGYTAGLQWYIVSCSYTGSQDSLWAERTTIDTTDSNIEFNVFGTVYKHTTEWRQETVTKQNSKQNNCFGGTGTGLPCYTNCDPCPTGVDDTPVVTETLLIDGQPVVPPFTPSFSHQAFSHFLPMAPNLFYVTMDHVVDASGRNMDERIIGVNESGTPIELLAKQTPHGFLPGPRYMPDVRELVWSYQPVTGESVHNSLTLGILYPGPFYQYV